MGEEGKRSVLRSLWEHHWWSVEKFLAAARELSDEEFRRELGLSYGSFHGALAHLVGSEVVWLERVERGISMPFVPGVEELPDLAAVETTWARCKESWARVLAEGDVERAISYSNTKGQQFRDPVWLVLTHLVDHGAAYRGVLVAALRLLGRTPPSTGLIFYERQKGERSNE